MIQRIASPLRWLGALAVVYLCAPFVASMQQFGLADWRLVDGHALSRAAAVSVSSATVATLLVALAGIPLAYCLARASSRASALLGFIVQLPLALPPLASGVLLLFLFGPYSWVGRLTGGVLTDSFAGIVLAQAFVAAPFVIVAARSAFASVDPILEDVAATLGHHARSRFLAVSLPGAWPAIRAGLVLAWLRAFGEFGATVMVAYHPYSLPVFTYVSFGAQGLPAMLPVLLPTIAIALAVVLLAGLRLYPRRAAPPGEDGASPGDDTPDLLPVPGALPPVASLRPAAARGAAPSLAIDFDKALGGFRLTVRWRTQARRLAIIGRSGSGKSMTLRVIAGLEAARVTTLEIDGESIAGLPAEARAIAYVPQDYGLFPHLTIARQLRFPVGACASAARYWLAHLGLDRLADRLPAALSLGQRQRVALARALVRPSRLILLDEPFAALDSPRRRQLRRTLRALQREIDATTVLVTHDPEDAALLADDVLVLDAGVVLQSGPIAAVLRRPASRRVAELLAIDNAASATVLAVGVLDIGGAVALLSDDVAAMPGARVMWRVDPERVRIDAHGAYPGVIVDPSHRLAPGYAAVQVGDAVLVCRDDGGGAVHEPGRACRVSCPTNAVEVWPAA